MTLRCRKISTCRCRTKTSHALSGRVWWPKLSTTSRSSPRKIFYPNQLSGGQQQLVGIARAVIHKPACCWPTNPPAIFTPARPKKSWSCLPRLNREGTTIVQVTHSDVNASYGSRTIQMKDGWLVSDTGNPALAPSGEAVGQ